MPTTLIAFSFQDRNLRVLHGEGEKWKSNIDNTKYPLIEYNWIHISKGLINFDKKILI